MSSKEQRLQARKARILANKKAKEASPKKESPKHPLSDDEKSKHKASLQKYQAEARRLDKELDQMVHLNTVGGDVEFDRGHFRGHNSVLLNDRYQGLKVRRNEALGQVERVLDILHPERVAERKARAEDNHGGRIEREFWSRLAERKQMANDLYLRVLERKKQGGDNYRSAEENERRNDLWQRVLKIDRSYGLFKKQHERKLSQAIKDCAVENERCDDRAAIMQIRFDRIDMHGEGCDCQTCARVEKEYAEYVGSFDVSIMRMAVGLIAQLDENGVLCGVRCYHTDKVVGDVACDCAKADGDTFVLSDKNQELLAAGKLVIDDSRFRAQKALAAKGSYHNNMGGFLSILRDVKLQDI